MAWNKEKINSLLPQGDQFLFIDEVIDTSGKRVIAKKYLDPNADFFKGHFPGKPVMPGVLIIEAMAQTSLVLYCVVRPAIAQTKPDYYLSNVSATFKAPAYPGQTLMLEATAFKITDFGGVIDVCARVNDITAATMRGTFAVVTKGSNHDR